MKSITPKQIITLFFWSLVMMLAYAGFSAMAPMIGSLLSPLLFGVKATTRSIIILIVVIILVYQISVLLRTVSRVRLASFGLTIADELKKKEALQLRRYIQLYYMLILPMAVFALAFFVSIIYFQLTTVVILLVIATLIIALDFRRM